MEPIIVLRTEHGDAELGTVQEATLALLQWMGRAVADALPPEHRVLVEKLAPMFDEIIKRGFANTTIDSRICAMVIAIVAMSSTQAVLELFKLTGIEIHVEATPVAKQRVDPSGN